MAAKSPKPGFSRIFPAFQRYAWFAGLRGRAVARSGGRVLETLGPRRYLVFVHDVVLAVAAFQMAVLVGGGLSGLDVSGSVLLSNSLYAVLAAIGVFGAMRLHRRPWSRFDDDDIRAVVKAAIGQTILLATVLALALQFGVLSFSLLIANWVLLTGLLLAPRAVAKLFQKSPVERSTGDAAGRLPVLLVGAGDNAEDFIKAVERNAGCHYRAVGIVDEMGPYLRSKIAGVEILGRITEIPIVVKRLTARGMRPRMLVITEDRLSADTMRMLLDEASMAGLSLRRIGRSPAARHQHNGRAELRPVSVDEFLDHRNRFPDSDAIRSIIAGSRILITGAAHSVGAELARQVCRLGPAQVTLVDGDATGLFELTRELKANFPAGAPVMALCDVRDGDHVRNIFARHRPQLVFHTSGMSHLAVAEDHPCETALANVMASRNVADACIEFGATALVLAASIEDADPSTVLGQTWKIVEKYCRLLDRHGEETTGATHVVSLRLPSIIGAPGSVVAQLERQLAAGGPLTVSDPEAKARLITSSGAAMAILEAAEAGLSAGTGTGRAYAAESSSPVLVRDLANLMIRLQGLVPEKDVEIMFDASRIKASRHDSIFSGATTSALAGGSGFAPVRGGGDKDLESFGQGIDELVASARGQATERVRSILSVLASGETETTNPDTTQNITRLRG